MPGKQCIYIVKAGDFVQSVAQKFNVPAIKYLRDANLNLENLFDDQHLKIVYPPVGTYIVIPRKYIVTNALKQLCSKIQPAVENNTMPVNHYEIPEEGAEESKIGDEKSLLAGNPFCHSNVVNKNNANKLNVYGADEFCGKHGICNKQSGVCECFPGYSGVLCRKKLCPAK